MTSAFPYRRQVEHTPRERSDVALTNEDCGAVLQAVSSDTAQQILQTLRGAPATAGDVADAVDTSIQNAHYHLERLHDVGLIEAVDTWYSTRGSEMTVYAAAAERLVVEFEGPDGQHSPPEGAT